MNMKKVSLDTWIQLLGMVGVLGGLVFVGLEMRQSQQIAIAGQQQERASIFIDYYQSFLEAGHDLDLYTREGFVIDENSTPEESMAQRAAAQIAWFIFENDFYQYQYGLMSDDVFEAKKRNIEYVLTQCGVREVFEFRLRFFSEDFTNLLDSF